MNAAPLSDPTPDPILTVEEINYLESLGDWTSGQVHSTISVPLVTNTVGTGPDNFPRRLDRVDSPVDALRAKLEVQTRRADELEDDLLLCMEVRALALEEAALEFQVGPDGQDYLDRSRMIRRWVEAAYERHGDGERAVMAAAPDSSECSHPQDAVYWNPYNRVVQCHKCGETMSGLAQPCPECGGFRTVSVGPSVQTRVPCPSCTVKGTP